MFVNRLNNIMDQFTNHNNFNKNKYYRWYSNLMIKCKSESRTYNSDIHEYHHILPKSFGGGDSSENIVTLTHREHFISHVLLTKFTKRLEKAKMCCALHIFFYFTKHRKQIYSLNSRQYIEHKKIYVDSFKFRTPTISLDTFKFKNKKTDDVFIGNRQEFKKYSKLTDQEISNILNNNMRHSKQWGVYLEDIGEYSFERKRQPKYKKYKTCKYCNKTFDLLNYSKWHDTNCKKYSLENFQKQSEQIRNLYKLR